MEKIIDQEKIQVSWGIDLFSKFILLAAKSGVLDTSQTETFQQELEKLTSAVQNGEPPGKVTEQFNQSISKLNACMKQISDATKYAPFPPFSLVIPGYERSGVLDQLDMVGRTLTESSEAKVMEWIEEGNHFKQILKLFSLTEEGKLHQLEAMAQLAKEIETINAALPPIYQLPLINLNAYESEKIV